MSNSIRTPKQGVTANSRRIAEAVDNEEWQKFRLSLKGISTQSKLDKLKQYWIENCDYLYVENQLDCDVCIRVDNYIKALCRGGQLFPGESLDSIINATWIVKIKK